MAGLLLGMGGLCVLALFCRRVEETLTGAPATLLACRSLFNGRDEKPASAVRASLTAVCLQNLDSGIPLVVRGELQRRLACRAVHEV